MLYITTENFESLKDMICAVEKTREKIENYDVKFEITPRKDNRYRYKFVLCGSKSNIIETLHNAGEAYCTRNHFPQDKFGKMIYEQSRIRYNDYYGILLNIVKDENDPNELVEIVYYVPDLLHQNLNVIFTKIFPKFLECVSEEEFEKNVPNINKVQNTIARFDYE